MIRTTHKRSESLILGQKGVEEPLYGSDDYTGILLNALITRDRGRGLGASVFRF